MSTYTETPKAKSLWHSITDEDFNIDFNVPFVLFTKEGGLLLVYDIEEMFNYADNKGFYDWGNQCLTPKGKTWFRSFYHAYMYIDRVFFETIKPVVHDILEDAKGCEERPLMVAIFKNGCIRVLDYFDFWADGRLLGYDSVSRKMRSYADNLVVGFANLNHTPATSPRLLLSEKNSKMSFRAYKIVGLLNREEPIEDVAVSHNTISDTYCIRVGKQELQFTGDELNRLCCLIVFDGWFYDRLELMRKLMSGDDYPYKILSADDMDDEHWEKIG